MLLLRGRKVFTGLLNIKQLKRLIRDGEDRCTDQLISMATTPPVNHPWDAYSREPAGQECEGPLMAKHILATLSQ